MADFMIESACKDFKMQLYTKHIGNAYAANPIDDWYTNT